MTGVNVDVVARQLADLLIYQDADSFVPIVPAEIWNPPRKLQPPRFTGPPPFSSYEKHSFQPGLGDIGGPGLRRWSLGDDSGLEVGSTRSLRRSGSSCGGTSSFSLDLNDGSEVSGDSSRGFGGSNSGSVGSAEELSAVEQELYHVILMTAPIRVPPVNYICQSCYEKGHYIEQCPKKHSRRFSVHTPYQGSKLCYGTFHCKGCGHRWGSYRSFRDAQQTCRKCGVQDYPKKQYDPMDVPEAVLQRYHGRSRSWVAVVGRPARPSPPVVGPY